MEKKPEMRILIAVIAAAAVVMIAPTRAAPQDPPRALLDRAIAAAGGLENLQRHAVLGWHGTATVTVPGRVVRIEGDWRIEPPDHAVVETFEIEKCPGSMRTLVIDGERGWSSRAGQSQPLPQALVAAPANPDHPERRAVLRSRVEQLQGPRQTRVASM